MRKVGRGQAAVEFVLVAPFLLLLIFAVVRLSLFCVRAEARLATLARAMGPKTVTLPEGVSEDIVKRGDNALTE